MSNILQALSAKQETMQSWLHHLHRYPEVAFEEVRTASYIADLLRSWGYEVTEGDRQNGRGCQNETGRRSFFHWSARRH